MLITGLKRQVLIIACWIVVVFIVNISILSVQQQHYVPPKSTAPSKQQQQQQYNIAAQSTATSEQQKQQQPQHVASKSIASSKQQQQSQQQQQQHYVEPQSTALSEQQKQQQPQQYYPASKSIASSKQQHDLSPLPSLTARQDKEPLPLIAPAQQHGQQPAGNQMYDVNDNSISNNNNRSSNSRNSNRSSSNNNSNINSNSNNNSNINYTNNSNATTGYCSQSVRLEHMRNTCATPTYLPSLMDRTSPDRLSRTILRSVAPNLLVSDQFKVMFCINYKTGSSSVRSILLNNSDLSTWEEADALTNDLRPLSEFPLSGIRYRLQHYHNVLMVRHPFDRLVSAYNDKLNMHAEYRQRLGQVIMDKYKLNVSNSEYESGKGVGFLQFIKFILDGGRDPHWESFSKRCFPCVIPYHFLMRTESFERDLDYIIDSKLAGKGHRVRKNNWRPSSRNPSGRQLHEFANIPSKLVADIRNKFRADMAIFGYDVIHHEQSVTANCKVTGQNCC